MPRNTRSRPYLRLVSYGVTPADIVTALDRNNGNVGAGYIEKRGEQYLIRAPARSSPWMDIIRNVVLSSAGGVPIRVRDVADVGWVANCAPAPPPTTAAKWCWARCSC